MSKRPIIHIGFPKTGTTYLQEVFFNSIDDVYMLRGWKSIRDVLKCPKEKVLLISDESFSGDIYSKKWRESFDHNIDMISSQFNNPKIIVGFREQKSFLISSYTQYLYEHGTKDFSEFYNENNNGVIKHEDLLYTQYLNKLNSKFEDVFVYNNDELKNRFEDFSTEFYKFAGILHISNLSISNAPRNPGIKSVAQVEKLIKLNRINEKLENIRFLPSLYSKVFKKFKLTPYHIALFRTSDSKKGKFELTDSLLHKMDEMYIEDWTNIVNENSF